eukprot:gene42986-57165_t
MPGLSAPAVLDAVLSVLPLDNFVTHAALTMQVVGDASSVPPAVAEFNTLLRQHGHPQAASLERFAFYERAAQAFAVVATGFVATKIVANDVLSVTGPETVSQRVRAYQGFTQQILSGAILPGQFISQRELMTLLDMPLGAVREMIPRLEAGGLIKTVPQRGLQIAHVDLKLIRNAFQVRSMIEREAVLAFVQSASDSELAAIEAAHQQILARANKASTTDGQLLAARLDAPDGAIKAYALFAHCFTCTKDVFAATRIAQGLSAQGIAVLRFDFTGLGSSEGDFANTNFSSNVGDLVAAAQYMADKLGAPSLIIGHSLGGAAVLAAAGQVASVKAVVTIGAPSDPSHVTRLFGDHLDTIHADGEAQVQLAGRPFTIKRQFLLDA